MHGMGERLLCLSLDGISGRALGPRCTQDKNFGASHLCVQDLCHETFTFGSHGAATPLRCVQAVQAKYQALH